MTDTSPEYLTVRELAALLRIKERKVYDLAASGDLPVSRATGKLLFPEIDVRAWIENKRSGPLESSARPSVLLGSHDPLLEWAVRHSQCGLASLLDGSESGLARFAAAEGIASGIHLIDELSGSWNIEKVRASFANRDAVLISGSIRSRGFVIRPDQNPPVQDMSDLIGRSVAAREQSSGANVLLFHLLNNAGVDRRRIDFANCVRSEQDAVLAVEDGQVDVAFGLETLARRHGLHFQPIIDERFDLLVNRRAFFEPSFQMLLQFCLSDPFKAQAKKVGGYRVEEFGRVLWNA